MTKILFGLNLENCPTPVSWQGLNKAACGPNSLLDILESRLGIASQESTSIDRVLAYRDSISSALQPDHFFSPSYQDAPLPTASLLLSWRDELVEAGYNLTTPENDSPTRIHCLSEIEEFFQQKPESSAYSTSRIQNILTELEHYSGTLVEELIVISADELIPNCWKKLLDKLGAHYSSLQPTKPLASQETALHQLQGAQLSIHNDSIYDDESVRIYTAATTEASLEALASHCSDLDLTKTAIIAESSAISRINSAFSKQDLPLLPCRNELGLALQQLPLLFLRSCYAPFNPQHYLEFLLHSVSPIPKSLRNALADAIDDTPGIGEHWQATLEATINKLRQSNKEHLDEEKLRIAYASWVKPATISTEELSGNVLSEALKPLSAWLKNVAASKAIAEENDAHLWRAATSNLNNFIETLSREANLSLAELEKLSSDIHHEQSITSKSHGEIGCAKLFSEPSQIQEEFQHIIWWNPKASKMAKSPWTQSESRWLSEKGYPLIDRSTAAIADEKVTSDTVLFARKSFTIFHTTQSQGSSVEPAGIISKIHSICGEHVQQQGCSIIRLAAIRQHPLPSKTRWWEFGTQVNFPPREVESFSSISKMINCPVDWVLDYHARLRTGRIFSHRVRDTALRSGSLLHSLAEEIFSSQAATPWQSLSESELHSNIARLLQSLFTREASLYLIHGNESAKSTLIHNAQRAFWNLIQTLKQAEVVSVSLERSIDPVPFFGGNIAGRIDFIARKDDGSTCVIDLKLGGKSKRESELKSNRHLQLAVYGKLMELSDHEEVATGYFILSNGGQLLTRNLSFFPETNPISPARDTPEGDWLECWHEFEEVYQWRRHLLEDGKVEVPVPGTEPSDNPDLNPPLSRWAPPEDACNYSPYSALTGWSPNS